MSFIDCVVSNVAIATLFALLASFAGRVTEKPQIKHTLWVLVLVKLVTPPLVHLPVSFIVSAPLAVESGGGQTGTTMVVQPVDTMEERSAFRPDVEYSTTAADSVQLSTAETVYDAETVATGRVQRIFFAAMPWVKALVCVWVVGSLIWFLLATTRLLRFRKVLHYAYAASEDVHAEVTAIAAKYGLQSIPRVLVADAVIPPLVWCLGRRATLVLPRGLLCRLGAEERAGLLAHELAHIKRFDHWIRWLEFVVLGVYWWNPLAWWARTQVQQSEEECCDAWVLWTFPERACLYARTLMQTVDFLAGSPEVKPGIVTAFYQGDSLKRRVELIVSASGSRRLPGHTRWGLRCLQ